MADLPRFLTLLDVAEILNTSVAQVYAMVRRGDLPAIRSAAAWPVAGERGRPGEILIAEMKTATEKFIDDHPFESGDGGDEDEDKDTLR